ncbi:alkylphosphonate utilization protein [Phaeovulum vinaykumarii]|uniref:Phosphonoacetate hydrolase n=1 Tax=Phaeovulum vinaykumarii TaxID=407234 RepID=A0A1N7LKZ5_9RHOB|nr:alkylphosphonate utilization protein [Phaeovulum vinaykumarii]SIS74459.1 phosphonoacetate hydrolase [Phaeovulum vinaykumarii]SOC05038.1 alkylphosphonate utilization operon protein PhnA [Phaeovulum vinaykumarii]
MTECALCSAAEARPVPVHPREETVALCPTCLTGVTEGPQSDPHWHCLNDAIWSPDPAVQVLAWRILKALPEDAWARDLLDIAYLEPEVQDWAEAGLTTAPEIVHRDSNGAVLAAGDTVTLIKDLPVKGAGFTAKRGTAVRNISLVPDNEGQIEGRVEGQRIIILTQFVKKA